MRSKLVHGDMHYKKKKIWKEKKREKKGREGATQTAYEDSLLFHCFVLFSSFYSTA